MDATVSGYVLYFYAPSPPAMWGPRSSPGPEYLWRRIHGFGGVDLCKTPWAPRIFQKEKLVPVYWWIHGRVALWGVTLWIVNTSATDAEIEWKQKKKNSYFGLGEWFFKEFALQRIGNITKILPYQKKGRANKAYLGEEYEEYLRVGFYKLSLGFST